MKKKVVPSKKKIVVKIPFAKKLQNDDTKMFADERLPTADGARVRVRRGKVRSSVRAGGAARERTDVRSDDRR